MLHLDISDEQVLDNAGIRVTAVRLLIWRKVRHEFSDAFSLADLEAALPTVDRSTIFQKYCVCHLDDTRQCFGHVHLTCRCCHRTFCLKDIHIPSVPLPAGFQIEEAEYVVKGICPQCNSKIK